MTLKLLKCIYHIIKRQISLFTLCMNWINNCVFIYFVLENLDKIMHLRFSFDACPMHSPFGFVHLMHQNLSARGLFCLNSLAKVNTQLLINNYKTPNLSFFRLTCFECVCFTDLFAVYITCTTIKWYQFDCAVFVLKHTMFYLNACAAKLNVLWNVGIGLANPANIKHCDHGINMGKNITISTS